MARVTSTIDQGKNHVIGVRKPPPESSLGEEIIGRVDPPHERFPDLVEGLTNEAGDKSSQQKETER